MSSDDFTFTGFSSPNMSQVPEDLFTVLWPRLSNSSLRVAGYVAWRTFKFHKQTEGDEISIHDLCQGTGLRRSAVRDAIISLRRQGILVAIQNRNPDNPREPAPTTYRLRFKGDPLDPPAAAPTDVPPA